MGASPNPGSPASHPALCLWPGKAVEDGSKSWDPAPCMGDSEEVPSSWLWIGSAPAVAVTWGVNHRTGDLPLYLSSSGLLGQNVCCIGWSGSDWPRVFLLPYLMFQNSVNSSKERIISMLIQQIHLEHLTFF